MRFVDLRYMPTLIAFIHHNVNAFMLFRVPTVLTVRKQGETRKSLILLGATRNLEENRTNLGLHISNPSQMIKDICSNVKGIEKTIVSVHCHDDLGMAVANSLAGIKNGARQVEGTINGIGERAGNAAIEEVVMAIRTRQDYFGLRSDLVPEEFYRTSRMVATKLGMAIPPNKAIIGGNAFSHSSGIHVDGVLKARQTYEIINPEDVGFPKSRIVLTARTGHAGVKHRLSEMGYTFIKEELDKIYERFLKVADKKQEVFDDDLAAIIRDEIHPIPDTYLLDCWQTNTGKGVIPSATVRLKTGKGTVEKAACGDGPVDALFKAIRMAADKQVELKKYEIKAVTSGTQAMGEVHVQLAEDAMAVTGYGASTDVIEASAQSLCRRVEQAAGNKK